MSIYINIGECLGVCLCVYVWGMAREIYMACRVLQIRFWKAERQIQMHLTLRFSIFKLDLWMLENLLNGKIRAIPRFSEFIGDY